MLTLSHVHDTSLSTDTHLLFVMFILFMTASDYLYSSLVTIFEICRLLIPHIAAILYELVDDDDSIFFCSILSCNVT